MTCVNCRGKRVVIFHVSNHSQPIPFYLIMQFNDIIRFGKLNGWQRMFDFI